MANEENLIPFKKGVSGNPKGRPIGTERILKELFLNEFNFKLNKHQAQDIIKNILSCTRKELTDMANNDELPFWISIIANKAQKDFKKGSMEVVNILFNRVYGTPTEEVHQTFTEVPIFKSIDISVSKDNGSREDIETAEEV